MKIELIETGDGSSSLFLPDLDETYHSRKGALTESQYVYIKMGLSLFSQKEVHILEFGFGTGLNALLSLEYAKMHDKNIYYTSTELHPLEESITSKLVYPDTNRNYWDLLHRASWNKMEEIEHFFQLYKHQGEFLDVDVPDASIDLIYYDAFAPSKQPEVWAIEYLEKAYQVMKPGAYLVTYCAQGQFKRNLKSIGFIVESLTGPPGKTEMIRAQKPET